MKHLRIAGKRVQTVELYLYALATVVTAMAFMLAVYLREALSSPFVVSYWDCVNWPKTAPAPAGVHAVWFRRA